MLTGLRVINSALTSILSIYAVAFGRRMSARNFGEFIGLTCRKKYSDLPLDTRDPQ